MSHRPLLFSDVFPNYDAWSQLRSIQELTEIVFTWRNNLHGEISDAEQDLNKTSGGTDEMVAEAATTDLYYKSIYRDAAAVQAAVGALAPFVEGFLVHAFEYLGKLYGDRAALNSHDRWGLSANTFWNPRKPNGLIQGLRDLRNALDLRNWLTDDRLDMLEILFVFRNRSLHFAYEWPADDLNAFESCVEQHGWQDHIAWAKSGGTPWMVYLKDTYLSQVLTITVDIVSGFVRVAHDRGGIFRVDPGSLPGTGPGEVLR